MGWSCGRRAPLTTLFHLPMLCSLVLLAVLLAVQARAQNITYAHVPGFFAQDDPSADPDVIGAVRGAVSLE